MERSGSASLGEMYLSWNPKDGEEPDVQTRGARWSQAEHTARAKARRRHQLGAFGKREKRNGRGVPGMTAPCALPERAGTPPSPEPGPAPPCRPSPVPSACCGGPAEEGGWPWWRGRQGWGLGVHACPCPRARASAGAVTHVAGHGLAWSGPERKHGCRFTRELKELATCVSSNPSFLRGAGRPSGGGTSVSQRRKAGPRAVCSGGKCASVSKHPPDFGRSIIFLVLQVNPPKTTGQSAPTPNKCWVPWARGEGEVLGRGEQGGARASCCGGSSEPRPSGRSGCSPPSPLRRTRAGRDPASTWPDASAP